MTFRPFVAALCVSASLQGCFDDTPPDLGRTRSGPGATVRYDLAAKPLPQIPLPIDTATWADPTSRTGLRINASLLAPTNIERQARERFDRMEGWGTFAPITVAFDMPVDGEYQGHRGAAIDIANVRARHQGDDYDFGNDAIYLVNLDTGIPVPLDMGNGNFTYTLKKLDRYWANDTRASERNLIFETVDETDKGAVTTYAPEHDTDFDGILDVPNLDDDVCGNPDLERCDNPAHPDYGTDACLQERRTRDECVTDHLLTWYERETDTLVLRPLLPLDEMSRYAVVLTDRLVDALGNPVKSPFELVYHASQRSTAERVRDIIDDPRFANYFGDLRGTGLARVGFVWSFTTQPTVDDMRRLRDGLFGQGPFSRWAEQYPPALEVQRLVGLTANLDQGFTDPPGWIQSEKGIAGGCPDKSQNLWIISYEGLRAKMKELVEQGFDISPGPDAQLLLRKFEAVDHMVIATFRSPFLLEGGPDSTDPNAAFDINYLTGDAVETEDVVQLWLIVPKETAEHQQPFDVNIYGHGYTGNFLELILYAGNMAEHGIATVGINAMGHGLVLGLDEETGASAALGGACYAPAIDALTLGRTRDLNHDGVQDSGGDFWSSYLFHTRDGVRQSILDHLELVRILRAFGQDGAMSCRDDATPEKVHGCDLNGDGLPEIAGDFDGDGRVDAGGPNAHYGTWGESLGGILSAIHGAIDAYVTSAVPGSGGGGLTDIGVRSFQGGVIEAVLLRIWGPLLVTVRAEERQPCTPLSTDEDRCTICAAGDLSLRWVLPDVNGTGEVEIDCLAPGLLASSTVRVRNETNGEVKCARVGDDGRFRVGLPSTTGDEVEIQFWEGKDVVGSYASCDLVGGPPLKLLVDVWGAGRFPSGAANGDASQSCAADSCSGFQGQFFGQGTPLTAPGDGYGIIRQTPSSRRFIGLAQAALEPGDPISFAPYYALKRMTDPFGNEIAPHAVLTLDTIGDQNVPLNSGIAFARATGALPFLRPDQAGLYPEYLDYVTPDELYADLGGKTPNQDLIDNHVVEGITALARHPAEAACETSANFDAPGSTYLDADGIAQQCFPTGCTEASESSGDTRICWSDEHCDFAAGLCVANALGKQRCDEALYDADDLDEGAHLYFEAHATVPHRLARLTASAHSRSVDEVWAPRLRGKPHGDDESAWQPLPAPEGRLTALLDAYTVPEGEHTFVNGNPCHAFDHGTYLTNLVARFFESDGTDIYYLSHPASHRCLAASGDDAGEPSCDYVSGR
jgi:hypothetical protein